MPAQLTIATMTHAVDAIGTDLGPTPPVTVTQAMINEFAEVTRDRQWIHTDSEQAAAGPFGTTIAHGYLTLSLVPHFLDALIARAPHVTSINYGLDRVRFPAVVPVGSTLVMSASIQDVEARGDDRALLRIDCSISTLGHNRPACVATLVLLYAGLH